MLVLPASALMCGRSKWAEVLLMAQPDDVAKIGEKTRKKWKHNAQVFSMPDGHMLAGSACKCSGSHIDVRGECIKIYRGAYQI